MPIFDIPKEVISAHILPFLSRNDLLRLRRVCKFTKDLADDFIRLYSKSEQYISFCLSVTVNGTMGIKTISAFMEQGGPVARSSAHFHLQNYNDVETESLYYRNFLVDYGRQITHFKIDTLDISMESFAFFEDFPNLQHLKIIQIYDNDNNQTFSVTNLPDCLTKLRSFDVITYFPAHGTQQCVQNSVKKLWTLFEHCSAKLEYVYHPHIFSSWQAGLGLRSDPGEPFKSFIELIEKREQLSTSDAQFPKYVDLMGYDEDGSFTSASAFYRLVTICSRNGIKILNADSSLIRGIMDNPQMVNTAELLNNTIVSTKYATCKLFYLELPLLEAVQIENVPTSRALVFELTRRDNFFQGVIWPNLKEHKMIIGKSLLLHRGGPDGIFNGIIFPKIFFELQHEKLEKLELGFSRDYVEDRRTMLKMYRPSAAQIVQSCANLKSLTIINWPGTNKMISQLWQGLPLLEKVGLENCENLGNVAFVGEDVANPVFLNLKRLHHLTLDGLEKSPKITDTVFTLVLRHVPLRSLYLTSHRTESDENDDASSDDDDSWEPESYPAVTVAGIRALLSGKFARTIEMFPIHKRLKLKDTTDAQIKKLELEFRSSNML